MAPLILKVPPSVFSGAVNQVLRLGLRHRANCTIVPSAVRFASTTNGDDEREKAGGGGDIPSPTDPLDYLTHKEKKRLFRVARVSKRNKTYDNDKIDKLSAMATYNLSEKDFEDLKEAPRPAKTYTAQASKRPIYHLNDVYQRAVKKHGSAEAIATHRASIVDMRKEVTVTEKMRMRMRVEASNANANAGADRVVGIAFTLNMCDMIMKFGAAYLTGSKSLFAEAIHSTMDTCNQLILLLGIRYSGKNPDGDFPYGYGNMRYVTSLISGCGILGFGCGLSMYHGISGLLNPTALEPLTYAYYALFMSLCFQGTSAITAYREVNRKAKMAGISIINYVKTSADPSLNVVLLEDTAAVTGGGIALCAISLSSVLNSPIPDSVGSIMIGALLGTVAMFIIRTNAAHLVGRSLPDRITNDIVARLSNDPVIRSVHDVKTTSLGVEHSRFKAEIDFDGRAITRAYLKEEADTGMMLREAQSLENTAQLEEFMEEHGEKIIDRVGEEIDRIEGEITKKHKDIRHVDLEAL